MTDFVTPELTPAAPAPRPAAAITHTCGAWWTGVSRAHCPAEGCHRTFSCDSAADKHRVGTFGADRRCANPAEVGLVARAMPFGVMWGWPSSDDYDPAARHRGDMTAD
jgi:hypothetical protein